MPHALHKANPVVVIAALQLYRTRVSPEEQQANLARHMRDQFATQPNQWPLAPDSPYVMPGGMQVAAAWWEAAMAMELFGSTAAKMVERKLSNWQECVEHGLVVSWQWKEAGGCPMCMAELRAPKGVH